MLLIYVRVREKCSENHMICFLKLSLIRKYYKNPGLGILLYPKPGDYQRVVFYSFA